jgi:serine/threonine protein kinase
VTSGRLLGQGGSTQTRLVEDAAGLVVGVEKRLVPRLRGDADARAALRAEAAVLRALAGRGAPRLLQSGEDATGAWLVMEHVPLPTVGSRIANAPDGRADFVASAAKAAFDALLRVHEADDEAGPLGVVHGDLSPENLLVADDGADARLVDLGLATFRDAIPSPTSPALRGTPRYLAPEVARGAPATARSDLFSLGLTLLHAASGEPPREGRSLAAMVVLAAEEPVVPYAERAARRLPPALRELLLSVVAFDPAARPSTAAVREAVTARAESW